MCIPLSLRKLFKHIHIQFVYTWHLKELYGLIVNMIVFLLFGQNIFDKDVRDGTSCVDIFIDFLPFQYVNPAH